MCCKFVISALYSSSSRWHPCWTWSNFLFCWSLESKKERDIAQEAQKRQHVRLSSYRQFNKLCQQLVFCAWYRVSGRSSNGACKTVYHETACITSSAHQLLNKKSQKMSRNCFSAHGTFEDDKS